MTLAALGIEAKTDGVDKSTDQLKELTGAAGKAEAATEKLSPAAKKAGADLKGLGNDAKTADGSLAKLAGGIGTVVGKLAAMAAAALSVGAYIKLADSWSDLRSQLGAAIGDMSKAGDMMQRMTDIANASYSPLDQTVQVYARNVGVLRDLGINASGAADFTESLNHMLVITATKGERAASVQNALSKAMAVGKLQADGLETVLANGGRVAQALADELGTTVSGLRAFSSEGKITGEVIANSIIKPLEDVRAVAGEMPATIGDAFTRIMTGTTALVGSFDQAFGVSGSLATALVAVGDGLASLAQSDFSTWADGVTGALVGLAQIALVLAFTRLPALVASVYAQATAFSVATFAARANTIALAAQAAAARGLSAAVAMMGGPWGIAAAGVAAFALAIYNTRRDGELLAETLRNIGTAQSELNTATERYYNELSQQALDAMTLQATASLDAVKDALKAAQDEFDSASFTTNFFGMSLGETSRMAEARAEVERLATMLIEAEARMSGVENAASNFALRAQEGTAAVVALNDEQQKALQSANEMTRSFEQRAALARTELQYGRESAQYMQEQLNQERQIQFAKIAALDITNQQKAAARQAYDQMVMTEAATNGWNVKLGTVNTSLSASYQALVKIRDTQPGEGWLATAISKAAGLATKLWDAVAANNALANLSVSEGPGMTTGSGDWAKNNLGFTRPGSELIYTPPKTSGGGGGGGSGGGGGGSDGALKALITELQTEREILDVWYQDKLDLINSYSDQELAAVGERHGAIERLNEEHQARLRSIEEMGRGMSLQGVLSGGAEILGAMGAFNAKALKVSQVFAAAEALVSTYQGAALELRKGTFGFASAAAVIAKGLAFVGAIKSVSAGGGGGGYSRGGGGSANTSQQSAPETPLRVTLDTIDPGAIYSGSAMIKMFEAIQKEAGNRGIVWVPAGA